MVASSSELCMKVVLSNDMSVEEVGVLMASADAYGVSGCGQRRAAGRRGVHEDVEREAEADQYLWLKQVCGM